MKAKVFFQVRLNFLIVFITTFIWLLVTYLTKLEKEEVLVNFYNKKQPGDPGWKKIIRNFETSKNWNVPNGIKAILLGCVLIYSCLFATGYFIYGKIIEALICSVFI
ncbi:MAG: hypothetical protein HWD82_09315 [Flavobacteriaceae bacterium]|nr:hypothetical protein [Flavobacteriaceae bacterium]